MLKSAEKLHGFAPDGSAAAAAIDAAAPLPPTACSGSAVAASRSTLLDANWK